jgi:hypothetical protein
LRLKDNQIATPNQLLELVVIAAMAAVTTLQLLQALDGCS